VEVEGEWNIGDFIFEDIRPELDLNKEYVDVDELEKEQEELDDILNDDLDEWRNVKHG